MTSPSRSASDELYGDLETFDYSTKLTELITANNKLKESIIVTLEKLRISNEANKELQKKLECLERNTTVLYKTAAAEIARKSREIQTLRITADESVKKDIEIKTLRKTAQEVRKKDIEIEKLKSRIDFLSSQKNRNFNTHIQSHSPTQSYNNQHSNEQHNERARKNFLSEEENYNCRRNINITPTFDNYNDVLPNCENDFTEYDNVDSDYVRREDIINQGNSTNSADFETHQYRRENDNCRRNRNITPTFDNNDQVFQDRENDFAVFDTVDSNYVGREDIVNQTNSTISENFEKHQYRNDSSSRYYRRDSYEPKRKRARSRSRSQSDSRRNIELSRNRSQDHEYRSYSNQRQNGKSYDRCSDRKRRW